MKKLMIAAAIVCAAAFANAASCNWTASYSASQSGNVGNIAYLFSGDATAAAATLAAFSAGDLSTLDNNIQSKAFTQPMTGFPISIAATFGDYTIGDWHDMYMVVFNSGDATTADKFQITAPIHAQVPSTGPLSMGFGNLDSTTWNTIQTVPEPTSGLLLLLGVAGLALRRRRA